MRPMWHGTTDGVISTESKARDGGSGRLLRSLMPLLVTTVVAAGCGLGDEAHVIPMPATPLEQSGFTRVTPNTELVEYVEDLGHLSPRVAVGLLGNSLEGRPIPYMKISSGRFGQDRDNKIMALVFSQKHGNEPSSMEGALLLARELAEGRHDDLLQHMDVLLVPQVNPDGGDAHRRTNAAGVDLNRSQLILDGHESQALRSLFFEWWPEVTVDVHEYNPWSRAWLDHGWLRLFDEQFGLPTNTNVPEAIRGLAEDRFLPFALDFMESRNFASHNYIVGSPEGIRYSTTNINDGRQSFAILNTFSLIIEGKNARSPEEYIERRAEGQRLAIKAVLRFAVDNKTDLLSAVRGSRLALEEGWVEDFVLTMGRESDGRPLRIPVEEVQQDADGEWVIGDTIMAEIENYRPLVVPEEKTTLPAAYIVPAAQVGLIELLKRHQVEMRTLEAGESFSVETLWLEGHETHDLERPVSIPVVRVETAEYVSSEGDVFIPTAQRHGLMLATALEPGSMHSLLQYDEFESLGHPGQYAVLRVPR